MRIEKKKLKIFDDIRGSLMPLEFKDLDFMPKRIFYATHVPRNCRRGEHAHIETKQLLICIKGRIEIGLTDRDNHSEYIELNENECVYIPNLIWASQVFLTGNDILLVLCSTNFDEKDYIDDMKEFLDSSRALTQEGR